MSKSMIEWMVGGLEEKRAYRELMKRVSALPEDYRFAFKNIQQYLYHFGGVDTDGQMFVNLVELFEPAAAEGRPVLDVLGADVSGFCDELIGASSSNALTTREQLNREILEHFHREEKESC